MKPRRIPISELVAAFDDLPWAMMPSALHQLAVSARLGAAEIVVDEDATPAARVIGALSADGGAETTGGVAVIPLTGIIRPRGSLLAYLFGFGGGGLQQFREDLADAINDPEIAAVIIDVDSPGGSVAMVPETAAYVRSLRGRKPIVAVADQLMASAAYWIASQADEIAATPSAYVGSVGAVITHIDASALNERIGIDPTYIVAGQYKAEGNEDNPLDDEARAEIQSRVDEAYGTFVADIAAGRGIPEATVRTDFGEGRIFSATRARQAGLVDSVETLDQVVQRLVGAPGGGPGTQIGARGRSLRADTTAPTPDATNAAEQPGDVEDEPAEDVVEPDGDIAARIAALNAPSPH